MATKLIVISGSSGSGKTTLLKNLELLHKDNIVGLPSITTRGPRIGDEASFRYVTREEFKEMEDREEFLWTTEVHGNQYGTRGSDLKETFGTGRCAISIITPDRLVEIYEAARGMGINEDEILLLHISSPGEQVLRERLSERGDPLDVIESRIADSLEWDEHVEALPLPVTLIRNEGTPEELQSFVDGLISSERI